MKFTQLILDQFGVWKGLKQTLHPSGLTVLYGPNGTGKSTILRFIRGILFGYVEDAATVPERFREHGPRSGSIHVEHEQRTYVLERIAAGIETGVLTIDRENAETASSGKYAELLGGIDAKLFQNVFALGLPELQQLGTLEDEDVARHIYAMTLGPEGRLLQGAQPTLTKSRQAIFAPQARQGLLFDLTKRRDELESQLGGSRKQMDRHRQLYRRREDLEARLEQLQSEQKTHQENIRAATYLQRVWGPWRQARECRSELASLPELRAIGPDAISQLDRLETELAGLATKAEADRAKLKLEHQQAAEVGRHAEFCRHQPTLESLFEQNELVARNESRIAELRQIASAGERAIQQMLVGLGTQWNLGRLERVDDSPAQRASIVLGARTYQDAKARRARHQRVYRHRVRCCRDREIQLRAKLVEMGLTGDSLDTPLTSAREKLDQVVYLGQLQLRAVEFRQRGEALDVQLERMQIRLRIPSWAYTSLFFFAVTGIGLVGWGLLTSLTSSILIGAIYALLGVAAVATTWALKTLHEREAATQLANLREQRRTALTGWNDIRTQLRSLAIEYELFDADDAREFANSPPDGSLIRQAAARLADLERLHREHVQIKKLRQSLSISREKLRGEQRQFADARKVWCDTLRDCGYDETVDVDLAFKNWQKVQAARQLLSQTRAARAEQQELEEADSRFAGRVRRLALRMDRNGKDVAEPKQLVSSWANELKQASVHKRTRRRWKSRVERRETRLIGIKDRVEQVKLERNSLLMAAGVSNRNGLVEQSRLWERRKELELMLQQSERELKQLASSHPDLAIVESDLAQFDASRHDLRLQGFQRDLASAEKSMKTAYEELGSVKQELKTLEADDRPQRIRWELAQLNEEIVIAMEEWYALGYAGEAMDEIRMSFERTNQPELLAESIPFLKRLTLGRYVNIWTPLGKNSLCVDDDRGHSWPVEHLSGGTREQLFLAIRLAMVRRFAKQGVELPLVLDDVTVNFDDDRAAAAADTLIEFAADGQQVIVLTSHQHVAEVFREKGVTPDFLPTTHSRRTA